MGKVFIFCCVCLVFACIEAAQPPQYYQPQVYNSQQLDVIDDIKGMLRALAEDFDKYLKEVFDEAVNICKGHDNIVCRLYTTSLEVVEREIQKLIHFID